MKRAATRATQHSSHDRRCAVKVCVACKRAPVRGHADDAYHCREVLGHVAPNWDAPGASSYFTEDAKPEEVQAWAAFDAVPVQHKKKPPKKKRGASPKFGTPAHKRKAMPTGAMSDLPCSDGAAAAAAPRGDFGLRKPLVFGEVQGLDASKETTALRAKELRRAGIPCVLTGVEAKDMAPFASRWLRPDGSLDDSALVRDVGNERAPILRYDSTYNDAAPIREAMKISEFVDKHWRAQDSSAYLHQWQFPLSSPEAFRKLLSAKAERLPGLDDDLLDHWLERCRGRSALQYLFMGGVGTRSRLHVDPGGLDLIIAPLVGWKEVTLVHRDDAELVGAMCSDSAKTEEDLRPRTRTPLDELLAQATPPSLDEEPILSLVRCWRHVLKPGEVLIMPEGTLHAVRNLTPALSYHRFHLDTTNPSGFWRALVDGDCPGIRPAEILWNGAHGAMTLLDNAVDDGNRNDAVERAECLLKLRHLVGAIVREFSESDQRGLGQRGDSVNSFDWNALLADADDALGLWAGGGGQRKNVSNHTVKSSKVAGDCGDAVRDSLYEPEVGDVVCVRFHTKQVRARVVDVALPCKPARFCRVHYVTYGPKYDEVVECSTLKSRSDASFVCKVGAACKVPWGDSSDEYDAEVVALHAGSAVKLHYLTVGSDWDQWVGRRKIIRQLRA